MSMATSNINMRKITVCYRCGNMYSCFEHKFVHDGTNFVLCDKCYDLFIKFMSGKTVSSIPKE